MFAAQSGGGGGGHEAMALLAARLMGGPNSSNSAAPSMPAPSSSPTAAQATIPRSVQAPQQTMSSTWTAPQPPGATTPPWQAPQPTAAKATIPRSVPALQTTSAASTAPQPLKMPTPTPAASMPAPVSDGPSLRGNAEQLEAARELSAGMTNAGQKSRGGSRQRAFAPEPSRTNRDMPTRSSAASSSASSYSAAVVSPRPRPSTVNMSATARIGGPVSQWNPDRYGNPHGISGGPPFFVDEEDSRKAPAATPPIKTESPAQKPLPLFTSVAPSSFKPSSPAPKMENLIPARAPTTAGATGGAASGSPQATKTTPWQMKDVTNTLRDRAADALPPHLRKTATTKVHSATTQLDIAPTSDLTSSSKAPYNPEDWAMKATSSPKLENVIPATKDPKADTVMSATKASKLEMVTPVTKDANVETVIPGAAETRSAAGASDIAAEASSTAKKPLTNGTFALPTSTDDHSRDMLQELKEEIGAVNKRIVGLEKENFALQKQVESMVQTEERRKFLGTDSAMAPFGINIQDPNGNTIRVQASASLKVGELIRRIRTKADLLPGNSKDPRVSVDGQQLGHAMTLGEASVTQDKTVMFTYVGGQ